MSPVPAPADATVRAWRFVPRYALSLSRDDLTRSRGRLEVALRSGHGLGVAPTLVVHSGREPHVELEGIGLGTVRWIERVLTWAYEPGQWTPMPLGPSPALTPRAFARRRLLPGETPASGPLSGEVVGTLATAFSALRPGIELRCGLRAVRTSSSEDWWSALSRPSAGQRPDAPHRPVSPGTSRVAGWLPRPAAELLWSADLSLGARADVPETVCREAARAAETAWRSLDGAGVRFSARRRPMPFAGRCWIASSELLELLPSPELVGPASELSGAAETALGLGRTRAGTVVSVPVEPRQGRHLAILGETGMGKSSLLVALAVRAARRGGLVLLDPLGETAHAVAAELQGESGRLLFIAPAETPPGINALEGIHADRPQDAVRAERRTSDLVHALRRVRSSRYEESSFWGPRLEEMLTRAVRAAAAFPGATLTDAHLLLSTTGFTRQRIPPGAEERVGELAIRIRERPDDADGARRLLHEVVRNPTLEQMICSRRPTLSTRELVAPGRVVLISGRAAVVGESTARYLLAVYLALLWSELLASENPQKTFVFLDEAQWFAHESLGEMLRLARRRNVHVVIATQSIASLPAPVQEAVWTNVADFVAFRGSPAEARELARAAPGVPTDRLLALPRGEAVALIGKGNGVHWIRSARIPGSSSDPEATSPPPGAGERRDPRPADIPTTPAGSAEPSVDRESHDRTPGRDEELLAFLRSRARTTAPHEAMRIPLAELRRRFPSDPLPLRRVGAQLGRNGAIVRTERSPEGPIWWLDPDRIGLPAGEVRRRLAALGAPGRDGEAPPARGEDGRPPISTDALRDRPGPSATGPTSQPKPS